MHSFLILTILLASRVSAQGSAGDAGYPDCPIPDQTCEVYGVDFQDGQKYFQNKNSSELFSFVQQFQGLHASSPLLNHSIVLIQATGCDDDFAYNLFVDPDGNQVICSNTDLQPDNTNELSTWYDISIS